MSTSVSSLPRRVLHVFNSATGGAALSTLGLIDAFSKQGISACAVCHASGSDQERQLLHDATEGRVLFMPLYWWNKKTRQPHWKRPLSALRQRLRTGGLHKSAQRVMRFAAEQGAELIHTNTILTPEGGLAARELALPHVWHIRELLGPGAPFRLPIEGPAFGHYMREHCSQLVANSCVTAERVRDWVPDDLLQIVHNGIDLSRFHAREDAAPRERLVVGMVGNLTSRWKKHGVFVEAATHVDRSLPIEWRLYGHDPSQGGTVAGDPYVDAMHARIAQAGLTDRFRWPGFLLDPAEIMSQLDILVHSANDESFGRVIVEAMASSLPVVGVRGGGVGEIVVHGETGLLADVDDAAGLARCIEQLARDQELRTRLGRAGRQRAIERFSIEASAAGMLRVYERAMSRPLGVARATNRNSSDKAGATQTSSPPGA